MKETEQTKLTMIAKGWLPRIVVAFAMMTLVPLLAVVFLGVVSADQSVLDRETAVLVGIFSILLSLVGISIVISMLVTLSRFRAYLNRITGSAPPMLAASGVLEDGESMTRSVNAIVGRVQHDRERLRLLSEDLQETVDEQAAELKQMREQLRDSRERFSKAIHVSPVPIVIIKLAAGRIVDANDAFCRLVEMQSHDVVERIMIEIHIGLDAGEDDRFAQLLQEQNRVAGMPFSLRSESGAVKRMLINMEPIKVGGKPSALVMFVDAS